MADSTASSNVASIGSRNALNGIVRQGVQQMLVQALASEANAESLTHIIS